MKKTCKLLILLLILFSVSLQLVSCGNTPQEQRKIIDTFASFPNSDEYILVTSNEIHIGKRIIDWDAIKYNGAKLFFIVSERDGAYAYSYQPDAENSVNILYVPYDSLDVQLLANVSMPSKIIHTEYDNGNLYFRTDDPETEKFNQLYFVYCISTQQTQTVDTDDMPYEIEGSGDHNRSSNYFIRFYNEPDMGKQLRITKKGTRETRTIDYSLLSTCEEGRTILGMGQESNLGTNCKIAFEKDGDIYVLFYYNTAGFGDLACHFYIMKYDFEVHTFEYYTSIFFEEYPGIWDLYIP